MSRPRAATSVAISRSAVPRAELLHHAIALLLRHAAVQRLGAVAARVERLGQLVDLDARAAEDDRRRRVLHVEHAAERRRSCARAARCRPTWRTRGSSPAAGFSRAIVTRTGSLAGAASRSPAMRGGIVAENSAVCRSARRRRRGSPRGPRRSPCRASRRPRRGPRRCDAVERRASCGGCDRARGPAWRRRRRRRA